MLLDGKYEDVSHNDPIRSGQMTLSRMRRIMYWNFASVGLLVSIVIMKSMLRHFVNPYSWVFLLPWLIFTVIWALRYRRAKADHAA